MRSYKCLKEREKKPRVIELVIAMKHCALRMMDAGVSDRIYRDSKISILRKQRRRNSDDVSPVMPKAIYIHQEQASPRLIPSAADVASRSVRPDCVPLTAACLARALEEVAQVR
jgi:hypothetical protein